MNSPAWTINPVRCENVTVHGVTIMNPADSPNTDGINPDSCRYFHISDCHMDVGDDCITIKSGIETEAADKRGPCENITITNCTMAHGHGGVVLGSEMSGDVRNVVISNCVFTGVVDQGARAGNCLESSASCMFAYAFAKGARRGDLPAEHHQLALRAYESIVQRFVGTTGDGGVDVSGCCVGTGLGGTPDRDGSFEYYAARPVATNDHHGVGAFLLASVEIERAR